MINRIDKTHRFQSRSFRVLSAQDKVRTSDPNLFSSLKTTKVSGCCIIIIAAWMEHATVYNDRQQGYRSYRLPNTRPHKLYSAFDRGIAKGTMWGTKVVLIGVRAHDFGSFCAPKKRILLLDFPIWASSPDNCPYGIHTEPLDVASTVPKPFLTTNWNIQMSRDIFGLISYINGASILFIVPID